MKISVWQVPGIFSQIVTSHVGWESIKDQDIRPATNQTRVQSCLNPCQAQWGENNVRTFMTWNGWVSWVSSMFLLCCGAVGSLVNSVFTTGRTLSCQEFVWFSSVINILYFISVSVDLPSYIADFNINVWPNAIRSGIVWSSTEPHNFALISMFYPAWELELTCYWYDKL